MNIDLENFKRSFAGVSGVYLVGTALTMVASIVLARTLSVSEFGVFGFAVSVAAILSIPVTGGNTSLLVRQIAIYNQARNWGAYRGIMALADIWVILFTVAVGLGAYLLHYLQPQNSNSTLILIVLMIPFLGLSANRNGAIRGLGYPALATAPAQIAQPILLVVGYILLTRFELASALNALAWYAIVAGVVFLINSLALRRTQPQDVSGVALNTDELNFWVKSFPVFVIISAVGVVNSQIVLVILGLLGNAEVVAYMRVAERGAQLVVFPLYFCQAVIGPYFISVLKHDNKYKLKEITRYAVRLQFIISLAITVILVAYGRPILTYAFGLEYAVGALKPMLILVVAQTISAALGAGSILLTMAGLERFTLFSQSVGLLVTSLVSFFLIPSYGASGAAIGGAIGLLVNRFIELIAVRQKLGIWISIID